MAKLPDTPKLNNLIKLIEVELKNGNVPEEAALAIVKHSHDAVDELKGLVLKMIVRGMTRARVIGFFLGIGAMIALAAVAVTAYYQFN